MIYQKDKLCQEDRFLAQTFETSAVPKNVGRLSATTNLLENVKICAANLQQKYLR